MATGFRNPALEWFIQQIGDELLVAQVLVRPEQGAFELRHAEDRKTNAEKLKLASPEDALAIAQVTESGAFRPLKSAPNLRRGWRILARTDLELEGALNRLYPGFIADFFAVRTSSPHITHYREFTNRQTGMYRITTLLTGADAFAMAGKCCSARYCLKHRLWTVEGQPSDQLEGKSIIPCLEPCAILLEYARKVVRTSQRENVPARTAVEMLDPEARPDEQGLSF
jgi:hypothetical protein